MVSLVPPESKQTFLENGPKGPLTGESGLTDIKQLSSLK